MVRYPITDKVVLVTGATGGIGMAMARALRVRGASVVLTGRRQDVLQELAVELGSRHSLARVVDVTDRQSLDGVVRATAERFGGLDVVIANAGVGVDPPTTIAGVDEREFERVIEVDLLGVWRTVRAALPQIISRRGHVVLTSSIYAYCNGVVNAAYAVSKAGVEQLGRALRAELAPHGATAGVLYPGWTDTPMIKPAFGGSRAATEMLRRGYPRALRTPISPERVAAATVRGIERRSARIIVPPPMDTDLDAARHHHCRDRSHDRARPNAQATHTRARGGRRAPGAISRKTSRVGAQVAVVRRARPSSCCGLADTGCHGCAAGAALLGWRLQGGMSLQSGGGRDEHDRSRYPNTAHSEHLRATE
jgi:NAD(P)-dependent dehydrogenase (short-subunit alcohol dehydrogenase family)